jgi:hypothetical protein
MTDRDWYHCDMMMESRRNIGTGGSPSSREPTVFDKIVGGIIRCVVIVIIGLFILYILNGILTCARKNSGKNTILTNQETRPASHENKNSLEAVISDETSLETAISKRLLTENDLTGLSKQQLRILRNTVYAKHGRKFKSPDLQEYFSAKDWHHPQYDDVDHLLNSYEKENAVFILAHE